QGSATDDVHSGSGPVSPQGAVLATGSGLDQALLSASAGESSALDRFFADWGRPCSAGARGRCCAGPGRRTPAAKELGQQLFRSGDNARLQGPLTPSTGEMVPPSKPSPARPRRSICAPGPAAALVPPTDL